MSFPNYDNLRAYIPESFKRTDFVLMGSAALAARGVRDVNDLDLLIRKRLWRPVKRLISEGHWPTKEIEPHANPDFKDDPDYVSRELVRTGWMDFSDSLPRVAQVVTVAEVFEEADIFEGYRVINLRHCLAIKVLANRPKDTLDMVALAHLIHGSRCSLSSIV